MQDKTTRTAHTVQTTGHGEITYEVIHTVTGQQHTRDSYFEVRLTDDGTVIDSLFRHYRQSGATPGWYSTAGIDGITFWGPRRTCITGWLSHVDAFIRQSRFIRDRELGPKTAGAQ
jgi:hypothetical protein